MKKQNVNQKSFALLLLTTILLFLVKDCQGKENLLDLKWPERLYASQDLLEKDISYERAKESWRVLKPLMEKHQIDFIITVDADFFEDLQGDARKPNCQLCKKQFKNSSLTQLHDIRKHVRWNKFQEQFLIVESAHRFTRDDFSHSEAEFRQCLRFAYSLMDNSEDSDDFCLDLLYGKHRRAPDSWSQNVSALWNGLLYIIFLFLTGLFYYFLLFKMGAKNKEENHNHWVE